jgi:CheY-like chemotaxis protein/HPt (histidine-containing phosphotransfer) domain-containing protein/anti-sigma regulatory factor (Ser/Thr protein kinase)
VEIVEGVCSLLDSMATRSHVGLRVFADPKIPETVFGDEFRVRQVLINLVSNAVKFSASLDRPGWVDLRVQVVERRPESLLVELIVADNGIGMEQETLDRLFVSFSQADESTTRRFGGTGLGLAISRNLVRLMGGELSVRSRPSEGSVFTVQLAFGLAVGAEAGLTAAADPLVDGLQCLIVGDDPQLGDDLAAYLGSAGATVARSMDFASAAATRLAPGQWVWVLLPGTGSPERDKSPVPAPELPDSEYRMLMLGRGRRRLPRVDEEGRVSIDLDALTRQVLFRSVALAAGRAVATAVPTASETRTQRALTSLSETATGSGYRILIAEDNAINRDVIQRQLGILGFASELTEDGNEALQRWRSGEFPLLLTDVRMPKMDGYALAAAIRAEEPEGRRTAILALTANALPGEEARCLAAGMDDYLVKPVMLAQLRLAIEKWLPSPIFSEQPAFAGAPDPAPVPPVNLSALIELVGDDPADIQAVLDTFRTTSERLGRRIATAIASGSVWEVPDLAHTLRSGAYSIGAARLGALCEELEQAAQSGRAERLSALWTRLQAQLEQVRSYLDS